MATFGTIVVDGKPGDVFGGKLTLTFTNMEVWRQTKIELDVKNIPYDSFWGYGSYNDVSSALNDIAFWTRHK